MSAKLIQDLDVFLESWIKENIPEVSKLNLSYVRDQLAAKVMKVLRETQAWYKDKYVSKERIK